MASSYIASLRNKFQGIDRRQALRAAGGYVLFVLLGMAPQLLQNGIFTETPIFSDTLPETDAISGLVVASFMTANVLTAVYFLFHAYVSISDSVAISVILVVSVYLAACTAFLWDSVWHGHSIGILAMSFCAGVLGNTSVMVFFAYATTYPKFLTSAMAVGYSLSGLLSFFIGLCQRATSPSNALFSPTVFFWLCCICIAILAVPFVFLEFLNYGVTLRTMGSVMKEGLNDVSEDQAPLQVQSPLLLEGVISSTDSLHFTGLLEEEEHEFDPADLLTNGGLDAELLSPMSSPSSAFSKSLSPASEYPDMRRPETERMSHRLSINTSGLYPGEEPEETGRAAILRQLAQILPVMLLMVYINALMFYVPGVIPFQTSTDAGFFWLNATFLVVPSIGAALSGVSVLRFYHLWVIAIVQTVLFFFLEIPSFNFMADLYSNPFWVDMALLGVFALLTGYMNTMVYLKIRADVQSNKIRTRWKIETLCRLAGLLSQIGGMCGVLLNIFFISQGAYVDLMDDDDSCLFC